MILYEKKKYLDKNKTKTQIIDLKKKKKINTRTVMINVN